MMLAGLGGVLIAPLFQLNDTLFTLVVLGSLFAVVVSGSLWGFRAAIPVAFAGGLLLGVLQNLVAGYGDDILPSFLEQAQRVPLGDPVHPRRHRAARHRARAWPRRPARSPTTAPLRDHREGLPRVAAPPAVGAVHDRAARPSRSSGSTSPWLQADEYEQSLIAAGIATGIVFLSFVVVTGLGGMVSLAQATFVVTGGFAAGWALNRDWGIDFPFVASHGQINFGARADHRRARGRRPRCDRRDPRSPARRRSRSRS